MKEDSEHPIDIRKPLSLGRLKELSWLIWHVSNNVDTLRNHVFDVETFRPKTTMDSAELQALGGTLISLSDNIREINSILSEGRK